MEVSERVNQDNKPIKLSIVYISICLLSFLVCPVIGENVFSFNNKALSWDMSNKFIKFSMDFFLSLNLIELFVILNGLKLNRLLTLDWFQQNAMISDYIHYVTLFFL